MEGLTIVGATPCVSSSLRRISSKTTCLASRLTPKSVKKHSLAALQPAFYLFSTNVPKRQIRARIFLPHLVASMVRSSITTISWLPIEDFAQPHFLFSSYKFCPYNLGWKSVIFVKFSNGYRGFCIAGPQLI